MIVTWSRGNTEDNMPEEILVDLFERVHRHPWWRARANLAAALLRMLEVRPGQRVLDAGCGWGVNLKALQKLGYQLTGLDISRRVLERLNREYRDLIEADLTQPLPDKIEPFDVVLALDVIEHLDDDRAAVARLAQLTKPDGIVIVSVPALPELFSDFDRVQGHRRRYLPETLRAAFVDTGLQVEKVLWWGAWLVPLLQRQRARVSIAADDSPAESYRRYLKLPPWPGPLVLRMIYALDQPRTLRGKARTGTSLFAVARRVAAANGSPRLTGA